MKIVLLALICWLWAGEAQASGIGVADKSDGRRGVSQESGLVGGDVEWREVDGVRIPIPPPEHPRLYLRKGDIGDLKANMETSQGKKILERLRKCAIPRTEEEEAQVKVHDFRYYFQMRGVTSEVQLQALDYLVYGDKKQARSAIESMLDTLKRTNFDTKHDRTRASGAMLMVGAMVYDWCYDRMTPAQRQAYVKEFVRIAGTMESHWPPKNTEPIAGHCSEWNVLRDLLSCGIAIYDEFPHMYNYVATMIFRDYVPARNFTCSGHNYHQGTGYVSVRYINDLISLHIFDRMGAGPIYDPSQQFVLYDFIYRRRPDGQVMPAGDVNPGNRRTPNSYAMPAMFAASYYQDAYIMNEYFRRPSVEAHLLMMQLLWMDFDMEPKSPEDLPLTRYSGSPFGWMIARTSWGDDAVIAEMKVNENFYGNHQHLDGGAFQIYYKGPLAIDSGAYQGTSGGYNSPHNKNYFKRTIAHNSLLIYDPSEKFACWNYGGADKTEFAKNDGGQRMPGDRWETCRAFEDLLSEDYTVGKALAHSIGPDGSAQKAENAPTAPYAPEYSYLKGDITKAYSAKVDDVRRSFVFLNLFDEAVPAALIVYDYIKSADPSFRKYWLLHSIEEPVISKSGTAAKRIAPGKKKIAVADAPAWEFTVSRTKTGDSGMLHNSVLLPEQAKVEAVGGPGKEFWVFGENYPNAATTRPDPANERGEWRVEVTPAEASEKDNFLNVMQVADNNCENFHKVTHIRGAGVSVPEPCQTGNSAAEKAFNEAIALAGAENCHIDGVVIADRAVIFAGNLGELKRATFSLEGRGDYRILVTDLLPGTWQVRRNGEVLIPAIEVRQDDGTLYFSGKPGTYELCR